MCSGESILAIGMTEPGTGSDLKTIRTTALREGDEYVINCSKTFISRCSLGRDNRSYAQKHRWIGLTAESERSE